MITVVNSILYKSELLHISYNSNHYEAFLGLIGEINQGLMILINASYNLEQYSNIHQSMIALTDLTENMYIYSSNWGIDTLDTINAPSLDAQLNILRFYLNNVSCNLQDHRDIGYLKQSIFGPNFAYDLYLIIFCTAQMYFLNTALGVPPAANI